MKTTVRDWHIWASVALGIPLLLVGLTAVFLAHEDRLGTKHVAVPAGWLPGYGTALAMERFEIRASALAGGERLLGTKSGVYRLAGSSAERLPGSPQDEIRAIAPDGAALLLAGKKGLWRHQGATATAVHAADCWHVSAEAGRYAAACKDVGLLLSDDGMRWTPANVAFPDLGAAASVPLSKVLLDLHTGKLFLGKSGEWAWIDALGIALVLLSLTGLVMWMRNRRAAAGRAS